MVIQQVLEELPERKAPMTVNFSAATTSNSLQETIEGRLEKRSKGVFAPAGGKNLVCFIDDLNMPQKSVFGFIPPLELLKLWADNGFWYDRQKQEVKNIKDVQLLGSERPLLPTCWWYIVAYASVIVPCPFYLFHRDV
eukprot:scaffold30448_cov43-Prasinocladus_malaysianus.AAC.1